ASAPVLQFWFLRPVVFHQHVVVRSVVDLGFPAHRKDFCCAAIDQGIGGRKLLGWGGQGEVRAALAGWV
ncbi:MAG: hypothetical protein VX438_13165, partial [Planctomycetota bacterium]|nr:hypothetical protein [Planctomycetota bacterium]